MGYESITQTLITGDSTIMYVGIFIVLTVAALVFMALVLTNYKKRADLDLWYRTKVIGYKVGIIEKAAKDEGVDIAEMKTLTVAEVAREELMNDLESK